MCTDRLLTDGFHSGHPAETARWSDGLGLLIKKCCMVIQLGEQGYNYLFHPLNIFLFQGLLLFLFFSVEKGMKRIASMMKEETARPIIPVPW